MEKKDGWVEDILPFQKAMKASPGTQFADSSHILGGGSSHASASELPLL